jgi:hypothetical protein
LCGTRVYAPIEKIGQEIKCPDCHTRNVVPPLPEDRAKKSRGPTLEGTEEFGMSEVVERPKYRPLVRERGEYETLSAVDPATVEHRLTVPGERPRPPKAAAVQQADPGEDEEISIAPPVEVVEAARDPRTVLPKPDLEPEDPMYDGRYDDGLIGDFVDPRSTDAWKRAPFLYGIVEFLFFPSTLLRLIAFGLLLAMVAALVGMNIALAQQDSGLAQIMSLLLMRGAIPAAFGWLVMFAAAIHAVIVGTGNGEYEITTWPDWMFYEWFSPAMYIGLAAVVAIVPGGLIAGATFAATRDDPLMAAFGIAVPPLLSWLALFPFVLHSMLVEDSVMAIVSPLVLRSWKTAADAWVIFYTYSIGIAFLLAGAAALMLTGNMLITSVGAVALVAVLFLYARLLGRLMWYTSQKDAAPSGFRRQHASG